MMEINAVVELVMTLAPAISAVLGIIISLIVGIKRIKQDNRDTITEVRSSNAKIVENVAQIAQNNDELRRENAELKKEMNKVLKLIKHVDSKEE